MPLRWLGLGHSGSRQRPQVARGAGSRSTAMATRTSPTATRQRRGSVCAPDAKRVADRDDRGNHLRPHALALDAGGNPHASYSAGNAVHYAYRDAAGWHVVVVDGSDGGLPSLALDIQGQPHILYGGTRPDYDLKYAYLQAPPSTFTFRWLCANARPGDTPARAARRPWVGSTRARRPGSGLQHNQTGRWQIYAAPLHDSGPMRRLSSGPGARFGRAGRRPATAGLGGRPGRREVYDIEAHDVAAGTTRNLTPAPPTRSSRRRLVADGAEITFASDRSGSFDTYAAPSTGGPPRLVWASPRPHWVRAGHPTVTTWPSWPKPAGRTRPSISPRPRAATPGGWDEGDEPLPAGEPGLVARRPRLVFSSNAGERTG